MVYDHLGLYESHQGKAGVSYHLTQEWALQTNWA